MSVPDDTKSVLGTKNSQDRLRRRQCGLPLHGLGVLAAAMFSMLTVVVFVYSTAHSICHASSVCMYFLIMSQSGAKTLIYMYNKIKSV